jgi:hypothetical protein
MKHGLIVPHSELPEMLLHSGSEGSEDDHGGRVVHHMQG